MKSMLRKPRPRQYAQTARAESAEATGQRIVDAFLDRLTTQWFDEITLDRVAEDAGVTVQTVIRRFGGKDGLLGDSLSALGERIKATRQAPQGDVDRIVENLLVDYEQTGDTIIRLLALEPRHPSLKQFVDIGRASHRNWVATAFYETLGRLQPAAREKATDKLVIITDVYTWKLLRRDMGRSVPAASATLKEMIRGAIAAILN